MEDITLSTEELRNYGNLSSESKARFLEMKLTDVKAETKQRKQRHSPFKSWLQVNNSDEVYKAEDWLMQKSPVAYRLLRFLAREMDNYNAIICSYKVMEEILGYSRQTLSTAINLLKEHKYIEVKKSGTSNVYLINKELYWKSWGTNHRYAEFGAKIIISETEQEEKQSKLKSERIKSLNLKPKKT